MSNVGVSSFRFLVARAGSRTESLLITDFTAGWCKPCQKIAPVFESLATEYKGAASFVKVDIDDLPEAFDGISIPAFYVSQNDAVTVKAKRLLLGASFARAAVHYVA